MTSEQPPGAVRGQPRKANVGPTMRRHSKRPDPRWQLTHTSHYIIENQAGGTFGVSHTERLPALERFCDQSTNCQTGSGDDASETAKSPIARDRVALTPNSHRGTSLKSHTHLHCPNATETQRRGEPCPVTPAPENPVTATGGRSSRYPDHDPHSDECKFVQVSRDVPRDRLGVVGGLAETIAARFCQRDRGRGRWNRTTSAKRSGEIERVRSSARRETLGES